MDDFYVILGLPHGATIRDVKRAYRRLARKYHPDINPGDRTAETIFQRVTAAYETLSDPDRRRQYDTRASVPASPEPPTTYQFAGFDFSTASEGSAVPTFGDLFADVFSRWDRESPADRPEHGVDLHVTLPLTFEQAMQGGDHYVTVTRLESCPSCRGAGVLPTPDSRCTVCQGLGTVRWTRGHMIFSKNCVSCGGTGRQQSRPCPACGRQGVLPRSETVVVPIPPGIRDGARLRVDGKGHMGRRGGLAGNLDVTVHVAPHPVFRREGDDLMVTVPVAIHEAALGARIDVPTIDGPTTLRVPPGTQSGQRFRLRQRGAPSVARPTRGDLIIEVRVVLPSLIDERSKELLREFGRIHTDDVRQGLFKTSTSDD